MKWMHVQFTAFLILFILVLIAGKAVGSWLEPYTPLPCESDMTCMSPYGISTVSMIVMFLGILSLMVLTPLEEFE
jgi:hypothetical protein